MSSRPRTRIAFRPVVMLGAVVLSSWACTGGGDAGDDGSGGNGQNPGTGGDQASGGNQATGGTAGGSPANGGANPSGGSPANGGRSGNGGTTPGTGGTPPGNGGTTPGTGGTPVTPGEPAELVGITEAHNRERRTLSLPDLTWDPALAQIAQTWAAKCIDTTDPVGLIDHNPDRAQGYNGSVGENIYGSSGTPTGESAVTSWVNEKKDYTYASNTCAATKVCGHYTQVVWKATTKVGCAFHRCAGLKYSGTIVCDYSPAGNVVGRKPY